MYISTPPFLKPFWGFLAVMLHTATTSGQYSPVQPLELGKSSPSN